MLTLCPCPRGSQRPMRLWEAMGTGLGLVWLPCWSASPPGNRFFTSFSCHSAADKHCLDFNRAVPSSALSAAPSVGRHRAITTTMDTPWPSSHSGMGKQCQLSQHSQLHPPNLSLGCFGTSVCCTTAARWSLSRWTDGHTAFLALLPCLQQGCPPAGTLQCPHGWHAPPST